MMVYKGNLSDLCKPRGLLDFWLVFPRWQNCCSPLAYIVELIGGGGGACT